jgi:hypothetical protein
LESMTLTGECQLTRDRTLTGRDQGGRLTYGWGAPQHDTPGRASPSHRRARAASPICPALQAYFQVPIPKTACSSLPNTSRCLPSAAGSACDLTDKYPAGAKAREHSSCLSARRRGNALHDATEQRRDQQQRENATPPLGSYTLASALLHADRPATVSSGRHNATKPHDKE